MMKLLLSYILRSINTHVCIYACVVDDDDDVVTRQLNALLI